MSAGHTPGLPRVINLCPTTADEQERMRERAWTDLRNADPTLHAEIVRRWNAHADLVAACEALVTLWDSPEPFTGADALQMIGEATERARAAIAKAGGA